jgi:hypothetical protein
MNFCEPMEIKIFKFIIWGIKWGAPFSSKRKKKIVYVASLQWLPIICMFNCVCYHFSYINGKGMRGYRVDSSIGWFLGYSS